MAPETYLIVGDDVTNVPNDKEQLNPAITSISADTTPGNVLADNGYFSNEAAKKSKRAAASAYNPSRSNRNNGGHQTLQFKPVTRSAQQRSADG